VALAFLAANAALRAHALHLAGTRAHDAIVALAAVALVALLLRPRLLPPALELFGASFFLYGFHSYRPQSQAFELLLCAFGIVLCLRLARSPSATSRAGTRVIVTFAAYALLATLSLLLLPVAVLEHRLFLEGNGFARAVLAAFPKDPLYGLAAVNRLWLFVVFAGLLSAQADGPALYRRLFRGIAWAAILAVILGLLDFTGVLSLDRYNLAHLFYGAQYRRLQSTFGNPSWFACFAACALPFVLLEFWKARGRARAALGLVFPLYAAALFLSGARAAWLAVLALFATLAAAALQVRRSGRALPWPGRAGWVALGATVVTLAVLVGIAVTTPTERLPASETKAGRLEGLSREMQYRGLGVRSPRRVAARYALELARLRPLLGLGHESFNLHLRAQLEIPGSDVASVVNTAIASDASETVFDDSHNTYLQVVAGTGAVGLGLFLFAAGCGLLAALRALQENAALDALAVLLGLVLFHVYGLFQGMAYIPVTFFLLPALTGYALALDPAQSHTKAPRARGPWLLATALVLVIAGASYARDNGYEGLKRRFGVRAYLPDEAAEFEGFYRPETGPEGEFRWMAQRGIVNLARAQPFRLRFTSENADAEREPVVLGVSFEGRDAGQIVFRRPGAVEQRFSFDSPGALRLTLSRTHRPGGAEKRELGVAVSAVRWE
jgi:O-antigen ligase